MISLTNVALEENIIGSVLLLNGIGDAVDNVFQKLNDRDFSTLQTREIFKVMVSLRERDLTPDINSLSLEPEYQGKRSLYFYTLEIWKNTISALNLYSWVDQLIEHTSLRIIQTRVNSINEIIASNIPITEKLSDIENIFSLETGIANTQDGAKHISESIDNYTRYLDNRWNNPDEVLFTTGISGLDDILGGGFEIGLHAIGANPKMGKTELMAKMIIHFAVQKSLPVYVCSMEMQDSQMVHRFVSSHSGVDKQQIMKGYSMDQDQLLETAEDIRIQEALFYGGIKDLGQTDIYIDDAHNNTVNRIRRESRKIERKHGKLGGIFVDYLQLMESEQKNERRDLEVGAMTRALKGMSKEFQCPVILLLQLNRGNTNRIDKRPMASDSRDSGAIEQDVDSWTGLYRDSVFNDKSHWNNITEIIVRLNRHGETGTAYQALTSRGLVDVDKSLIERLKSQDVEIEHHKTTSGF